MQLLQFLPFIVSYFLSLINLPSRQGISAPEIFLKLPVCTQDVLIKYYCSTVNFYGLFFYRRDYKSWIFSTSEMSLKRLLLAKRHYRRVSFYTFWSCFRPLSSIFSVWMELPIANEFLLYFSIFIF